MSGIGHVDVDYELGVHVYLVTCLLVTFTCIYSYRVVLIAVGLKL